MKTTLVPVEEYLHTSYRPDCEYVDGELVERNLGERDHSELQGHIYAYFLGRWRKTGLYPYIEQRVRVGPKRYRVPDVCLMAGRSAEQIFSVPPVVVIEILSPEDRMSRMLDRINDHLRFGVRYVWVIDPRTRKARSYTPEGEQEVPDGILRTTSPDTELGLADIFAEIEDPKE